MVIIFSRLAETAQIKLATLAAISLNKTLDAPVRRLFNAALVLRLIAAALLASFTYSSSSTAAFDNRLASLQLSRESYSRVSYSTVFSLV